MKRALPISVRFFLLAFAPVGLALAAGFFLYSRQIEENVRTGMAQALAESQHGQARLRLRAREQKQTLVAALAENATLKAGFALWSEKTGSDVARRTIEDQLHETGSQLGVDLIAVAGARGDVIACLIRVGGELKPVARPVALDPGPIADVGGELYETVAAPVNTDVENLGMLTVGQLFNPASFHPESVFLREGRILAQAGLTGRESGLEAALAACKDRQQCPVSVGGESYVALRIAPELMGGGYWGWTLHSVEAASAPLLGSARRGLWLALGVVLIAALLADVFGARAVVKPLAALIGHLDESERSGELRGGFPENSSTLEVNQLARAYNQAARSVAESQRRLDEAYLELTRTMAQALDARDRYTAGHSSRVSSYASAIAEAMNLAADQVESIRTGATLHDIGKIGIPDAVLQKAGPLSPEEQEVIRRHPLIGKRILEGVSKFRDYLSIVEMHHENHDGTGYPWGLRGESIPLGARIVHVVDAYDAMTTSRPYRKAMAPETAAGILRNCSGTQFDPAVVEVFLRLLKADPSVRPPEAPDSLVALDEAIARHHVAEPAH